MFRLSSCQKLASSLSFVGQAAAYQERRLSLKSFRFPWLTSQKPSNSAVRTTGLPSSVQPWEASDGGVLTSSYPHAPAVAQVDFPVTKHELWIPPHAQSYGSWSYDVELAALCARLRFPNENSDVLCRALTHPSYLHVVAQEDMDVGGESVGDDLPDHYGPLSCYGSAACRMYVVDYLHMRLPNLPAEGINELTKHLLQEARLSAVVQHLGIVDLILRSSQNPITTCDHATLTHVFHAVVGALLTSVSAEAAQSFVHDFVIAQLEEENLADAITFDHPKLMLRHLLREQHKPAPVARLLNEAGHNSQYSVYQIAIYCGNSVVGQGFGRTLELGEEEACRDALREFFLKEIVQSNQDDHHRAAALNDGY